MSTVATTLLEREEALRSLGSALDDTLAGSGRVALVTGEAGVGKTSVVRAFTDQHADHVRVLLGSCEALFTPRPLGPVRDIAGAVGGDLARLIDTAPERSALLSTLLTELTTTPTVAVFEDVHWADEATLDALKYVGRRIESSSCLLVLTYRDDEVGSRHPLRLLLGDLPADSLTRLALAPLSRAAVALLAEQAERPDNGLFAATGGNPFYVTEVLAADDDGVPATVRDAVLARALGLEPDARAVVDLASVVPGDIEHLLLDSVLAPAPEAISACLERGMLVASGQSLAFRHELARRAVLEALEPWHRQALDRRVLEALEARPERDVLWPRLAHHAEALGDQDAILRYAPAAAERAAAVNAHREACDHYAHAVRAAAALPQAERAGLLDAYGRECGLVGRLREAVAARFAAADLWRVCGEARRESESLARASGIYIGLGRDALAEEASRRALEVLAGQDESAELALAYRTQASLRMLQRDTDDAVSWAAKATSLSERLGDAEGAISATITLGAAYLVGGDVSRGRASLERAVVLSGEAGLEALVASAYLMIGSGGGEVYELELARDALERGIAYALARDLDYNRDYQLSWFALVQLYTGAWDDAAATATDVLGRESGGAISRIMALLALGRLRARRGDPDAGPALDEALELAEQTGTLQRLGPVRAARAEWAWLTGDAKRAAAEAAAAYELAVSKQHAWFIGELAYWQWKADTLAAAPENAAEPFSLQLRGAWSDAAAAWQARGCPYETARALAESGDEGALLEALGTFEELGARPAADGVRRTLRELGASIPRGPRAATRASAALLTRRESEVLQLLAMGLRNTEIAERLVLSTRTVEHHVAALLRKLGAHTRGEATAKAARLGLLEDG